MRYEKSRKQGLELFLFIIILAIFASGLVNIVTAGREQRVAGVECLSSGWYYINDGKKVDVTLPAVIRAEYGEDVTLYYDGITGKDAGKVITTRGAQYNLRMSLQGEELYKYQEIAFRRNVQMKSKLDCDGTIPMECEGKTLQMTYSHPQDGWYKISEVYIGSESAVELFHFRQAGINLALSFSFIILSVIAILIAVYLKYRQMPDGRFRDVSIFLIICSIWLLTDSSVVQMHSQYPSAICLLSFYMFMLLAVPMLHFVQKIRNMKDCRILSVGIVSFYLNALVQGMLNYAGIFDFVEMLFVTHILLWIWVFVSVALLWKEYQKKPEWDIKMVLAAYMSVSAGGILALVLYWLFKISYYGAIFELGILIFLIIIIADTVIHMAENLRYRTEAQAYDRLRRQDCMTGLKNRSVFEEELTQMQKEPDRCRNKLLIFLDIDSLHWINDEFGRTTGDETVLAAVSCIKNVFGKTDKYYRIDGDEFAVVLYDPQENLETLSQKMEEEIRKHNRYSRHRLSMSWGFSFLWDEEGIKKTVSKWKEDADLQMERNKKKGARKNYEL